jgi:hypothetical protein
MVSRDMKVAYVVGVVDGWAVVHGMVESKMADAPELIKVIAMWVHPLDLLVA